MKHIDNLYGFAPYPIDDAVGGLDQFTKVRSIVAAYDAAKVGERCQAVSTPENTLDRPVRGILRVRGDPGMDVGK